MSYATNLFDDKIVSLIKNGAIGFMPSDTIYGLSCLALNAKAVERLHKIKRRDQKKPFIILFSNLNQLNDLGIITTDLGHYLRYWPGKLTVIAEAPKAPFWLHKGTNTLAVRQPDYPELFELINRAGPIISTSANLSGSEPAQSVAQAKKYFGGQLDFYVNVGRRRGQPSTIVRSGLYKTEILRQGAVKIKEEK